MEAAVMSTKGQVVIPKEVRDLLGLTPGTRLEFVVEGASVRIVPHRRKNARPEDGPKILDYRGPRISDEDIAEAVRRKAGA